MCNIRPGLAVVIPLESTLNPPPGAMVLFQLGSTTEWIGPAVLKIPGSLETERTTRDNATAILAASASIQGKSALLDTVQMSERSMKVGAKQGCGLPSTRVFSAYVYIFLVAVGVVLGESTAKHDDTAVVEQYSSTVRSQYLLQNGVLMQARGDGRRASLIGRSPF